MNSMVMIEYELFINTLKYKLKTINIIYNMFSELNEQTLNNMYNCFSNHQQQLLTSLKNNTNSKQELVLQKEFSCVNQILTNIMKFRNIKKASISKC